MMSQYNKTEDTAVTNDVTCGLKSTIQLWKILVTVFRTFEIKREREREREKEKNPKN